MIYKWKMIFPKTGEVLEGSRSYANDMKAIQYLDVYLYKHHAAIREDSPCRELTVIKEDGHLLYSVYGDVFGSEVEKIWRYS